jgi:hypothetical protein
MLKSFGNNTYRIIDIIKQKLLYSTQNVRYLWKNDYEKSWLQLEDAPAK